MDVLFQLRSNEFSSPMQKEKLLKEAERLWDAASSEEEMSVRKVDREIYKSILYNLEIRKVYLDSTLSLVKFSSIVGTNTTYLSNTVNKYFGCNLKCLVNRYRIEHAKQLLNNDICVVKVLYENSGFASQSVFYAAFKKIVGCSPTRYQNMKRNLYLEEEIRQN